MKQDYHAKLIVHGLPNMDKRAIKRLVNWLKTQAENFEKVGVNKEYAKVFTARLMK